jgi:hypothetical protein
MHGELEGVKKDATATYFKGLIVAVYGNNEKSH